MKHRLLRLGYRALLRLVPEGLRHTHAREMERLLSETLDIELRKRGWLGYLYVLWGAVADVVAWSISARAASRSRQRDVRGSHRSISGLRNDVAFAFKSLRRSPGFSAVVMLTLVLGLGGSIAIFSVVDFVLLRPLPFAEPDELYTVWETNLERGRARSLVAPPTFKDWRDMAESFTGMSLLSQGTATITGGPSPERVSTLLASPNIFTLLGVPMHVGSTFPPEADEQGSGRWVVLSFEFWQNWFGEDPGAVGRTLVLDDELHTIVGVLPREFRFPESADLWQPLTFEPEELSEGMRGARYLEVIARLRSNVTVDRATAEMAAIAETLGERHPNNAGWGVTLVGLRENMVAEHRHSLTLLLLATILVLIIACVNVVNLVLARASDRSRERAVQTALGASVGRLFKQSLIQHVMLAVTGGLLGALAAFCAIPALVQLAPTDIPRLDEVTVDGRVLLVSLGVSVVVGLVLSLVSLASSAGADPNLTIRSAQVGGAPLRHNARRLLIVSEVGLSLVLLIGAGLLLRSFARLQDVDPGFISSGITTVSISLPGTRYGSDAQRAAFFRGLQDRLSSRREIRSVAATTNLPLSGSAMRFGYAIDGRPELTQNEQAAAEYHAVTPGYFSTLGIRVERGRTFSRDDDAGSASVVIVNRTFADRYWHNEDPIGKRISVVSRNGPTSREIVGVIADVLHAGLASSPRVEVYVPLPQDPWAFVTLVVRAEDEMAVAEFVKSELATMDPSLPLGAVLPIERVVSKWLAPLRFQMVLVGLFAVTALLLATLGIYGVVSYVVSLKTNEIGVRMALGAHTGRVFGSVVGQGLLMAAVGTLTGVAAAFWVTRYLAVLLYQVSPTDPLVFAIAPVLVLTVALLGSALPARRAVRVDPVEALREV